MVLSDELRDNDKYIMCRLFGFRSIFESQMHSSLVSADNALGSLSKKHSDGWGVAFYQDSVPHLIKSLECAIDDKIFHKISGIVSSRSVIAHVRKATQGKNNILNSHPFQYGKWIFAHNGNIKSFENHKDKLLKLVDEKYKRFILGKTDSEILFFIILSQINKSHPNETRSYIKSIEKACHEVCNIIGTLTDSDDARPTENYLTFMLTNGDDFFALQAGQPLFFSTHKSSCPEKNECSYYNKSCESISHSMDQVNHLIVSSESIDGQNEWTKMKFGELIAVNKGMILSKTKINLEKD